MAASTKPKPAADVRESAPFTLPGVFDDPGDGTDKTPREAQLLEPTEVQMKTLGRIGEAAAKTGGSWRTVSLTDQMLASLFVEQSDWDDFEVAMITGACSNDQYVDLVRDVIKFWTPEKAEAPTTGPQSTRRARRAR